jgi:hypothetical protein
MKLLIFLFALFLSQTVFAVHQKALLRDIDVLTLHRGQFTTGRRGSPVPQLNCVGGTAHRDSFKVETVQCKNTGFNGRDYSWKCESQLDKSLKLGKITVSCEGFDRPDDPYVLVGSCGLEYTLDYTNQQTQHINQPVHKRVITSTTTVRHNNDFGDSFVVFITFIFVFFITMTIVSWCITPRHRLVTTPYQSSSYATPYTCSSYGTPMSPVVVTQSPTSAFVDGMVIGSTLSHRHVPTHTHTETVITETGSNYGGSGSNYGGLGDYLPDSTHTSTGFGDTIRR